MPGSGRWALHSWKISHRQLLRDKDVDTWSLIEERLTWLVRAVLLGGVVAEADSYQIYKISSSIVINFKYYIWHSIKLHTHLLNGIKIKKTVNGIKSEGIDITDRNIVDHSLRHTYNTIMKGILTAEVLREFTGHRSEQMTKRYDNPQLIDRLRQFRSSIKDIDNTWK